jgi:hypothetical protein
MANGSRKLHSIFVVGLLFAGAESACEPRLVHADQCTNADGWVVGQRFEFVVNRNFGSFTIKFEGKVHRLGSSSNSEL